MNKTSLAILLLGPLIGLPVPALSETTVAPDLANVATAPSEQSAAPQASATPEKVASSESLAGQNSAQLAAIGSSQPTRSVGSLSALRRSRTLRYPTNYVSRGYTYRAPLILGAHF